MRAGRSVFIFWIALFCLCACSEEKKSSLQPDQLKKNSYASYFKIYAGNGYSVLVNYLNAEKTDSMIYVVYKGSQPRLDIGAHYVEAPVERAACLTSVFVGFVDKLNAIRYVKAVDNMDFVTSPSLQDLFAKGDVKQLSKSGTLNIEETVLSRVKVIFANPRGETNADRDSRLLDAQIVPVVCADYFENDILGRAEWIKVFGLFFDMEEKADSLFAETVRKYHSLQKSTDTCAYRPTVFTEVKTNDTWFVAGAKSSLAKLIHDAGGEYVWKDLNKVSATPMNIEQVFDRALNADFWINLNFFNSRAEMEIADKRYTEFKAYKRKNLYNNNAWLNAHGGNAYWETGLCNPDEILADLIYILHPPVLPDHKLIYYKQLK
jgi:iron complex transport system substrate-binding protein